MSGYFDKDKIGERLIMSDPWKSGAEHAEAYFDECLKLRAEIERLRAEWPLFQDRIRELKNENKRLRNAAIEECARAIENLHRFEWPKFSHEIAAAIRALKSNTGG